MRNFVKQFAIPLQALTALGICLGLVWMVFVVAGFNPAPPTALDLQARSTEDQSFASLNSTAAALALGMVSEMMPSPIVMPVTGNSTPVPSSSPTIAVTLRVVSSGPESNTPSSIFSFFFQPTQSRDRRDDEPTTTLIPTRTRTLRPTFTALPPTSTKTNTPAPPPPTHTPLPPTLPPTPVSPIPTTTVPPTAVPTTAVPPATIPPTEVTPPPTEETPPPTEPTEPTATEPAETPPPIQDTPVPTSEPATPTP